MVITAMMATTRPHSMLEMRMIPLGAKNSGRTLTAASGPHPVMAPTSVTPIGTRLPFVTSGAAWVTARGCRIPFWCR